MGYKDPEKERQRGIKRRTYFREYQRKHYNYSTKGSIGHEGEIVALKVLIKSKKINRPCDLSWNGKLVDVKTAKPTLQKGGGNRWKFLLSRQKNKIDLFLLIRKDGEGKVIDMHLIPDKDIRAKNLSFNSNTAIKYFKYLLSL